MTSIDEIKALIRQLYMAGTLKTSHVNLSSLWATDGTAPMYFRATMSYKRFYLLLKALRFDIIDTRADRSKINKFVPIQEL